MVEFENFCKVKIYAFTAQSVIRSMTMLTIYSFGF